MNRRALIAAATLTAALAATPNALGHIDGKAQPRIAGVVSPGNGLVRTITVRLTDADDPAQVISGARVVATGEMTSPHLMRGTPWVLRETSKGTYRAAVQFLMPGRWDTVIDVSGKTVVAATARLEVDVVESTGTAAAATPATPSAAVVAPLPTRVADDLTGRDLRSMAVLWLHGISALSWVILVLFMLVALSTRPSILAERTHAGIARAYRRWGAWAHWGLIVVIVGTGIYNMRYVTPFRLAYSDAGFDRVAQIPYGSLYEAILIVKLGLFGALLVTGTQLLIRTVRNGDAVAIGEPCGALAALREALGPAGIFYLATVPLILAAAMALRYVHVLSHVADVISTG